MKILLTLLIALLAGDLNGTQLKIGSCYEMVLQENNPFGQGIIRIKIHNIKDGYILYTYMPVSDGDPGIEELEKYKYTDRISNYSGYREIECK